MPENTVPAFLRAVELGVTTLEMDVVVSKDDEIVVSHEPWMSHEFCSHPGGRPVKKSEEKKLNIFRMSNSEIQKYDCGMRLNEKFPDQRLGPASKPTLKVVVRSVERFAKEKIYTAPRYNIEIKSKPSGDHKYHPAPEKFARMLVDELRRLDIEHKTTIQSFDLRVLEELNKVENRKFTISYLVTKGKNTQKNLSKLSFTPDIYSPRYTLVSAETVAICHAKNIKVIPWTINEKEDMARIKSFGCDGGITDYPDRFLL